MNNINLIFDFIKTLPETEHDFIIDNESAQLMIMPGANLYTGGTSSCKGCNEEMAIKMMLAVTGNNYGKNNIGLIYASKCELFYSSTFPFNPFQVTCVNNFSDNGLSLAYGIRKDWDQMGWENKKIWLVTEGVDIYNNELLCDLNNRKVEIKILNFNKNVNNKFSKMSSQINFFESNIVVSDIERFILTINEANKFEGISLVNVNFECQLKNKISKSK